MYLFTWVLVLHLFSIFYKYFTNILSTLLPRILEIPWIIIELKYKLNRKHILNNNNNNLHQNG